MKALFVRSVLAALLVLLAVSSSAIEPGPPSRGEIGVRSMMGGEKKPDEKNLEKGPKSEEKPPAPVVEVNVGGNEGSFLDHGHLPRRGHLRGENEDIDISFRERYRT